MTCPYCNDMKIVPEDFDGEGWWKIAKYQGNNEITFVPCRCAKQEQQQGAPPQPDDPIDGYIPTVVISLTLIRDGPTKRWGKTYRGIKDAFITDGESDIVNPEKVGQLARLLCEDLDETNTPIDYASIGRDVQKIMPSIAKSTPTGVTLSEFAKDRLEKAMVHITAAQILIGQIIEKIENDENRPET